MGFFMKKKLIIVLMSSSVLLVSNVNAHKVSKKEALFLGAGVAGLVSIVAGGVGLAVHSVKLSNAKNALEHKNTLLSKQVETLADRMDQLSSATSRLDGTIFNKMSSDINTLSMRHEDLQARHLNLATKMEGLSTVSSLNDKEIVRATLSQAHADVARVDSVMSKVEDVYGRLARLETSNRLNTERSMTHQVTLTSLAENQEDLNTSAQKQNVRLKENADSISLLANAQYQIEQGIEAQKVGLNRIQDNESRMFALSKAQDKIIADLAMQNKRLDVGLANAGKVESIASEQEMLRQDVSAQTSHLERIAQATDGLIDHQKEIETWIEDNSRKSQAQDGSWTTRLLKFPIDQSVKLKPVRPIESDYVNVDLTWDHILENYDLVGDQETK